MPAAVICVRTGTISRVEDNYGQTSGCKNFFFPLKCNCLFFSCIVHEISIAVFMRDSGLFDPLVLVSSTICPRISLAWRGECELCFPSHKCGQTSRIFPHFLLLWGIVDTLNLIYQAVLLQFYRVVVRAHLRYWSQCYKE